MGVLIGARAAHPRSTMQLQHCMACHKAFATVHILDLQDGSIVEQKHLCTTCAENAGMVQKAIPLQSEMLELLGNIKLAEFEAGKPGSAL